MTETIRIGFVLFPNLTQLDFTGPLQVLCRAPGAELHLVAASKEPVPTDAVLSVPPTTVFEACPQLDVLVVPGGHGVQQAIADERLVGFVREQARGARFVTSVCTGAFILGAAGLLEGKRATTHWAYHSLLERFGAKPEQARVVCDGNLYTGGGVTAGVDFALTLLASLADEDTAQAVQLALEYDPAPPYVGGHPQRASDAAKRIVEPVYSAVSGQMSDAIDRLLAASS